MTQDNYRDMRAGILADVFVPLFPQRNYTLRLYGTIANPQGERCVVVAPSLKRTSVEISDWELNRFQFPIAAQVASSGVYSVLCSFQVYDRVADMEHPMEVEKSLNITFIEGKWILPNKAMYIIVKPLMIDWTDPPTKDNHTVKFQIPKAYKRETSTQIHCYL